MHGKSFSIKLNSVEDVQYFNAKISKLNGDYDLSCGRYTIDAKSILGIFSLDLSRELIFTVHNLEELEEALEKVGKFIIKEVVL